jgi:hypothetical protein
MGEFDTRISSAEERLQIVQLRTAQHFSRQLGDEIAFFCRNDS